MRVTAISLGALLACSFGAQAAPSDAPIATAAPPTAAPPVSPSAGELTRAQAVTLVQRRYHARVVRTELLEQQGRRVYVFKLLSSGSHVWTVRIDARTGAQVQP